MEEKDKLDNEEDEKVDPNKTYLKTPEETVREELNKRRKKIKLLPDPIQHISRT